MRCYVDQFTTEIKQYSSEEDNDEGGSSFDQDNKDEVSIEDRFLTPQKGETDNQKYPTQLTPTAPITPVKIEKFG